MTAWITSLLAVPCLLQFTTQILLVDFTIMDNFGLRGGISLAVSSTGKNVLSPLTKRYLYLQDSFSWRNISFTNMCIQSFRLFPQQGRMFCLRLPKGICTCKIHSHREIFHLPTCASCPSASDKEWMYTAMKNQTFELTLPLDNRSYSFSCSNSELFFKIHISMIPVRLCMTDDRFDNFPLMADKFWVRSTDKGFVAQSNDEAMKQCLYGDL